MTSLAVNEVPIDVLKDISDHCIEHFKYQQLSLVLEKWYLPSFHLSSSSDNKLNYCNLIKQQEDVNLWDQQRHRRQLKNKTVQTFFKKFSQILMEGSTRINTIDLRNYPLNIKFLEDTIRELSTSKSPLKIIIDLSLTEHDIDSRRIVNNTGTLTITVRNLFFYLETDTCLCHETLVEYLRTLFESPVYDFTSLESVQLSTIDLRRVLATRGELQILDDLKQLLSTSRSLRTIDLSYNAININGDDGRSLRVLHNFLSSFPKLKRLDLSGNRLQNYLAALLKDNLQLEYLNIGGSQLRQIDVSFLSSLTSLKHLDLSNNNLSNKLNVLKSALSCLQSLEILEMESCGLSPDCYYEVQPYLRKLTSLRAINLQYNNLSRTKINLNCISYTKDDYEDDDDEYEV